MAYATSHQMGSAGSLTRCPDLGARRPGGGGDGHLRPAAGHGGCAPPDLSQVGRLANVLSSAGVGKGDVVALYLPVSPIAVAVMMATARIGAVHNVVFAGFSAEALAARVSTRKEGSRLWCSR